MTDPPERKILHVIGNLNRWAIQLRAEYLAQTLPKQYVSVVSGYRQLPDDPSGYDVVHFHTPCNLHDILARRPAYLAHPAWGFEVISKRRDDYLERARPYLYRAAFCVAKNPRLAEWVRPYLIAGLEAVYIP
ncbi:MAG TPA: hypothetical protein VMW52_04610, partial [Phycisphaerae bacterium]|nr:hypothetical protein [Phycisphaerae bacterium]